MDIIVDISDQAGQRFRRDRTLVQNKFGDRKLLVFIEDSFHQIIRNITAGGKCGDGAVIRTGHRLGA